MQPEKGCGPDEIPDRILKETAGTIALYLAAIYKQSLSSGELPQDWLDANISPVFKKGSRYEAAKSRPISLTSVSVCCKTMEHVICTHILSHLDRNDILSNLQHGFRKGYSCDSQLLPVITVNDLMSYYDKKTQVHAALLWTSRRLSMLSPSNTC